MAPAHGVSSPHLAVQSPPQSTPASDPFFTPSLQVGNAHLRSAQNPELQSPSSAQTAPIEPTSGPPLPSVPPAPASLPAGVNVNSDSLQAARNTSAITYQRCVMTPPWGDDPVAVDRWLEAQMFHDSPSARR
jgi:hypothetical protein